MQLKWLKAKNIREKHMCENWNVAIPAQINVWMSIAVDAMAYYYFNCKGKEIGF